jgi:SAM-dependent methyltransferase
MKVKDFLMHLMKITQERLYAIFFLFKPAKNPDENRYTYQKKFIRHQFTRGEKILDIGSGGDPFPYATLLADRYLEPTYHRSAVFKSEGKPVIICDISALPFIDGAFDYVVAAHVLEHVEDPIKACLELQRVAKSGFIETPTLMKDALFSWAKGMHKWHLLSQGNRLFFFDYTDRMSEGIRSSAWCHLIFSTIYHPLQEAFNDNQDIFNVMFEWENQFDVTVIKQDGSMTSNRNDSLKKRSDSDSK